ncbi:hypothetical protein [Psychromonas sp. SP041]|uniref:hypothetical protein n=1 Tax=Psychromonas sp. SP041 TaxID=1365007 RepID=UPI0010C7D3A7|nr:hypothetical protein [Psychromonas sp. SP041]
MFTAIDVRDSLLNFENSLLGFIQEISSCNDINVPASNFFSDEVNKDASKLGSINRAIKAYSDIWYLDDEDGRTTRTYQGIISGGDSLIDAARLLNTHKTEFQEAVKGYTKGMSLNDIKDVKSYLSSSLHGRKRLVRLNLQRLNLNSCYRKVPYLIEPVNKITYSLLTRGKSIKKLKVSEVREMLKALGGTPPYPERIDIQLNILAQFSDHMEMARIQENSPIIKANISLIERDLDGKLKYLSKKPPLPIVLHSDVLPAYRFYTDSHSNKDDDGFRKIRDDKKLEDEPTIKSLRVHRYLS